MSKHLYPIIPGESTKDRKNRLHRERYHSFPLEVRTERYKKQVKTYNKDKAKWFNLLYKYKITKELYFSKIEKQDNKCLICKNTPEYFVVDHCHITGNVRGLLCTICNLGLGSFLDSTDILYKAINYLEVLPIDIEKLPIPETFSPKKIGDLGYKNEAQRKYYILSTYNITLSQFYSLLEYQKYMCCICNIVYNNTPRYFHIDHDHITKKIRGIICNRCNSGLGSFKDSKVILNNAIEYLRNNQ